MSDINIKELIGKTLKSVYTNNYKDEMFFVTENDETYQLFHNQDCCEAVEIEDISGDLNDLIGSPIIMAEESTNCDDILHLDRTPYSFTWTFYKLATIKGYVNIRWLGESNGYYSESVDFRRLDNYDNF